MVAFGDTELDTKLDLGDGLLSNLSDLMISCSKGGEAAVSKLLDKRTLLANVRAASLNRMLLCLWACSS